jgi:hypothetical protein
VSEIVDLQAAHDAVLPDVRGEWPSVVSEVSTRAIAFNGSPPRIVWVPSRDRWEGAQKRPRGGGSTGKNLQTCLAGADLHVWGASIPETWQLVQSVVRALRRRLGSDPFLSINGGQWLSVEGLTSQGELYVLSISVALDVPELPARTTTTITAAAIDNTRSSTGDGNVDAGETG